MNIKYKKINRMCYYIFSISNILKFKKNFPNWKIKYVIKKYNYTNF